MPASATTSDVAHELVLTRLINAPRHKLFRCWTEPALITRWFTPPPWKTIAAEIDPRAGGASLITMQGPDGTLMPNRGVYLEFVKDERIVFTDAYTSAWVPSAKPFFTCILTFEDDGGRTRYTRPRPPLDGRGLCRPREDGFSGGLGHCHRPARGTGRHPLTASCNRKETRS